MKTIFTILIANLASLACVIGAIYLASTGTNGWGWFLFTSVILMATLETGTKVT